MNTEIKFEQHWKKYSLQKQLIKDFYLWDTIQTKCNFCCKVHRLMIGYSYDFSMGEQCLCGNPISFELEKTLYNLNRTGDIKKDFLIGYKKYLKNQMLRNEKFLNG